MIVGAVVAVVLVVVVALVGYVWFSGGSGEASVPISAPTLAPPQPVTSTVVPTVAPTLASQPVTSTVVPTVAPTVLPTLSLAEVADSAAASSTLYRIVSEESEVRFSLAEILDDEPNQVIGATDQVAGDILIDFENPEASRLGQIRVNVRTLRTDNNVRDRAIRSFVLESGQEQYEFVEFDPIELAGLPDSLAVGDTMEFQIVGNLTVKRTAAAITFEVKVTVVAADRIEGTATGSVRLDEYDLFIPDARGRVTEVAEDLVLEIDFVAVAVTE